MKTSFSRNIISEGFGVGDQHAAYEDELKARIPKGRPVSREERDKGNVALTKLFMVCAVVTFLAALYLFPSFRQLFQ